MEPFSSPDPEAVELFGQIPQVNIPRAFFPFCIVWTPLPILTWFCPPIGHLGISTSDGLIHDFAGAFYINVRCFKMNKKTKIAIKRVDP